MKKYFVGVFIFLFVAALSSAAYRYLHKKHMILMDLFR